MWNIFFNQLLFGTLAIAICFLFGSLILSFCRFNNSFYFKTFVTNIIGFTSIILIYSIYKASFRTINICIIIPLLFLLYQNRKLFFTKVQISKSFIIKGLLYSIGIYVLFYLFLSFSYFNFAKNEIKALFPDFYLYAYFSKSLQLWGIENYYMTGINFFFPSEKNLLLPYHYPELWFSAFWSDVLKISNIKSYYLISYPIFLCTYFIGLQSLFTNSIKNKIALICVTTGIMFISVIYFVSPSLFSIIGQCGSKLAFIYVLFLLCIILYKQNKLEFALIILVTIPIFNILFLPSVFGLILFYIVFITYNKNTENNHIKSVIILSFTIVLSIGLFYLLNNNNKQNNIISLSIFDNPIFYDLKMEFSIKSIFSVLSDFSKAIYKTSKGFLFAMILGILPFVIVTIKSQFKIRLIWLSVIIMLIIGNVMSVLYSHINYNNIQFTTNLGVILIIACTMGISVFVDSIIKFDIRTGLIIFFLLFTTVYFSALPLLTDRSTKNINDYKREISDFAFMNQISILLQQEHNIIMTFVNPTYCVSDNLFPSNDEIFFLNQINDKSIFYCIGNPDAYFNKGEMSQFDKSFYDNQLPLNVWINRSKTNTLETFIRHFKIKYFYFKDNIEIPHYISLNAEKIITSPHTRSIFIIIK